MAQTQHGVRGARHKRSVLHARVMWRPELGSAVSGDRGQAVTGLGAWLAGGCAVCGDLGRSSVKICHPVCLRFEHILHLSCFNKKGTLKIKHLHFRDVEAVGS